MNKFLFFCLLPIWGMAQGSFSLDQCIELSQKHSPQGQQIALIREANSQQIKALQGNNLPQSSLGGQATWQSEVTRINIALPNVSITPPPKDQYKLTLDVSQNLYDGGLTKSQINVANASAKTEEQKVLTDLYQLREQVSNLYFGAMLADKLLLNANLLKQDLDNRIAKMQASVANGVATKTNMLQIETRKIEVEQQISALQKQQTGALEGLSLLTGVSITSLGQMQNNTEQGVGNEEVNRPELSFLEAQKQSLMANEGLLKAKYQPKVSAFATGGYGRPSLNFLSPDFNPYFIGGVQLRIPLSQFYTGGKTAEVQQIRINQNKIDKQKEQFLLATQVRLASQKQEIKRLEALLESDKPLVEMRTKLKQVAEVQLENGVITSADYLTELNNENIARQNQSLHETQLAQAKNGLRILVGQ